MAGSAGLRMAHPNAQCRYLIRKSIPGFCFWYGGWERLTMLVLRVTDLRSFFENDLRFPKQFK